MSYLISLGNNCKCACCQHFCSLLSKTFINLDASAYLTHAVNAWKTTQSGEQVKRSLLVETETLTSVLHDVLEMLEGHQRTVSLVSGSMFSLCAHMQIWGMHAGGWSICKTVAHFWPTWSPQLSQGPCLLCPQKLSSFHFLSRPRPIMKNKAALNSLLSWQLSFPKCDTLPAKPLLPSSAGLLLSGTSFSSSATSWPHSG